MTGVAAVAALETGVVPGRARVHDLLGLTGPDGVVPDVPAGPAVSGSFDSFGRRTKVGYSILYPHGYDAAAELPVVLVLHGRGGDHTSAVNDLGIDRYLTSAVRAGTPPFALATVDGGRDSYWHRRADGNDPGFMLDQEFLPLLARRGLRTSSFGVLGWSMGGYGA
ncbi:MAG TPA: alpha/beta hydrolase-fold protein, partial [Kribbella sp.]